MPKYTYGSDVKARVKRLLEALLAFVHWEFEESFDIKFKWEAEDSNNPKLIIKTTLVTLELLTAKDKSPGKLTKTQIREALNLLKDFLNILDDNRTQTKGVDTWHFTLKLWSKDKEKNLQQFEQAWEDSRPEKSKAVEANFKKSDAFDWGNICLAMLEAEKLLTTNQFMRDEDEYFDIDEIHVPLALVERKKPDKRGEEILPEQGSRLYEPEYEEKQRFEHEQFLQDILKDGKGKHNGKRIAIIGEPGAGKTTLLRKIAFWVQENTEYFPISISLADLQEFTLEDYLLRVWLKTAMKVRQVTPEMEDALCELFKSERVWLLLDSVDEMPVQGEEPLWAISNQLKGWVAQARVVLTCRLNVWEANRNVLADKFEIYRTLEFSYGDRTTPDRVGEFIAKWFNKNPNLGQQLRQELDKPGKERIKDLVKNPLRLALLCSTWSLWRDRGGLPDTKAKVYHGFVDNFYEWKGKEFPTDYTQQEQLNRALGELAKLAIDQTASRFRLKHSLVCKVLGKPDEGLFQLALQLGWLNKVGLAAESPDEWVYAFWHTTFEEYFAATAIDDWDFFLPRQHQDKPVADKYRIFEPQWKEVILLWLGREDVDSDQKEEFIKALVEFDDGIEHEFYEYRSYFLAAAGIAEFKDYSFANTIVAQIVKWGFGYFNTEKQEWMRLPAPIQAGAITALQETIRDKAIDKLIEVIDNYQDESVCLQAAYSLGEINPGNQKAIAELLRILETTENHLIRMEAAYSLGEIGTGNEKAIAELLRIIEKNESEYTRYQAAGSLQKIGIGNQKAIDGLLRILETNESEDTRVLAVLILGEIGTGNQKAIDGLLRMLKTNESKDTHWRATRSLGKIGIGNQNAIDGLLRTLETSENHLIRREAAYSLGEIGTGNQNAIDGLLKILETTENQDTRVLAAQLLGKIGTGNQKASDGLLRTLETTENQDTRVLGVLILGEIGTGNQKVKDGLLEIMKTTENEVIRVRAAYSLGKIDPGNQNAIDELVKIMKTTENEDTREQIAYSLAKIDPINENALDELLIIIERNKSESNSRLAAELLGEIGTGNQKVRDGLVKILETGNEYTRMLAAESLGKFDPGNQKALVDELLAILKKTEYLGIRILAALILGEIGAGNKKAIDGLLGILETTEAGLVGIMGTHTSKDTRWQAAESLEKIATGNPTASAGLVRIMETTESEDTHRLAADSLKKILTTNEQCYGVISALKNFLTDDVYKNNFNRYKECYEVIWKIAQIMPYRCFYQAWHNSLTPSNHSFG